MKYVIYSNNLDYYKVCFDSILNEPNVFFIQDPIKNNKILKLIHRIHHSSKINKVLNLPFKQLWNKYYLPSGIKPEDNVTFIFHGNYFWMKDSNFFEYLREKFPNGKLIYLLMDTIESYNKYFKNKFYGDYDLQYLKRNFHHIISYNKIDCRENNLIYYPSIYSKLPEESFSFETNSCPIDVLFIGRAKDRLDLIHKSFKYFEDLGLNPKFYIHGVSERKMIDSPNIIYNKYISYSKVLELIKNSKAIFEVVQSGSEGFTLRINEALVYNKVLISNNPIIKELDYYKTNKMIAFNNLEDINLSREKLLKLSGENYNYNDEYNPFNFLRFIDDL